MVRRAELMDIVLMTILNPVDMVFKSLGLFETSTALLPDTSSISARKIGKG